MNANRLKFLAWTFSAFMPPKTGGIKDAEGEHIEAPPDDLYELLDVSSNANADELKKAYRKRSLELHPDKLRQRGMRYQGEIVTEEVARIRFQHMKAAYDILNDPKKRRVYDALGHQGMDFVINPSHAWDPHVLLTNLAKSSVLDRAKLMVLVLLFFGLVLLQPILLCTKVDHVLEDNGGTLEDADFVVIFIPLWIFSLCLGSFMVIGRALFPLFQWISLVVGVLFIALKLDKVYDWPFFAVFSPFYLWMLLRLIEARIEINTVEAEMSKMVTIGYLEKYVINEQSPNGDDFERQRKVYDDLTPEERDDLNKLHTIVSVPPSSNDNPEVEENELKQIERSIEYQEALARLQSAFRVIKRIFLPEIPLLVLVIIQLDLDKNWNWGLTFCPLWIVFFLECCGGCHGFFCTANMAHIEVQEAMAERINKKFQENAAMKEEADARAAEVKKEEDRTTCEEKVADQVLIPATSETTDQGKEFVETPLVQTEGILETPASSLEKNGIAENTEADGDNIEIDGAMSLEDEELLKTMFTMDEDTFQYYAQAEAEAESKATEAQTKALSSFPNVLVQLLFSVLFVVKLNQVYEEKDDESKVGTDSFSSFWIFFPLFLVAGCTISCCFCAIFCASDLDSKMSTEGEEVNGDEEGDQNGDNVDIESKEVVSMETSSTDGISKIDHLGSSEAAEGDVIDKTTKREEEEELEDNMHDLD